MADSKTDETLSQEVRAPSREQVVSPQRTAMQFVWATDGEGRIEWTDGRASDFIVESMVGLNWCEVPEMHGDDRGRVRDQWEDALSSGSAYESEHRLRCGDGEYRWFSARAFPMLTEEGEIDRWFGSSADIHEVKLAEQRFHETEGESDVFSLEEEDSVDLELAQLLDIRAIQSLVESLYAPTGISFSIRDPRGVYIGGTGFQRMCDLHRRNKATCRLCDESDRLLTENSSPGQVKIRKCKNGLWDTATPIMVHGRRVGDILSGQFLIEDDEPDRELFLARARRFGFDEEDYLCALSEVPRVSREVVEGGMALLPKLANLISELCYYRLKIDRAQAQRSVLAASLRTQQATASRLEALSRIGSWRLDPELQRLCLSDEACRIVGVPEKTPLTLDGSRMIVHPEDRERVQEALIDDRTHTLDIGLRVLVGQEVRGVRVHAWLERNEKGELTGGYGLLQDCTTEVV